MDGWTETTEEFTNAKKKHLGRFFCVVGLLIGNFLISNIFIAIIIMQISEATEEFRVSQYYSKVESSVVNFSYPSHDNIPSHSLKS
jgi:hypothetical protein